MKVRNGIPYGGGIFGEEWAERQILRGAAANPPSDALHRSCHHCGRYSGLRHRRTSNEPIGRNQGNTLRIRAFLRQRALLEAIKDPDAGVDAASFLRDLQAHTACKDCG